MVIELLVATALQALLGGWSPSALTVPIIPATQTISSAPIKNNSDTLGIATTAESVVIADKVSGAILFAKDQNTPRPIASLTKLMTALVFLEQKPDLQATITITAADQRPGNIVYLKPGDQVTVHDLLAFALIASSNEAAAAMARISSQADFPAAMNAMAAALSLRSAHFADPTGLDANNMATAVDVLALVNQAFAQPDIAAIVGQSTYTATVTNRGHQRKVTIASTNRLFNSFINQPPYHLVAGKTGHLDEVGYCLALQVRRQPSQMVTMILLGSNSQVDRWQEAKGIIDWVFRTYHWPDTIAQ